MTTIMLGTTTCRWLSSFCVMVLMLVVSLGRLKGVVISGANYANLAIPTRSMVGMPSIGYG
jgi:hypothetical protein